MHSALDLEGTIRPGLDILANEIVISLKKRVRFPQNLEIYKPGLVLGYPYQNLLEFELKRMERHHAELGRYVYATQDAFSDVSNVPLIIKRKTPKGPIRNYPTGNGKAIIDFYTNWIREACEPGTDSDIYGETVTADVETLILLRKRITLGKSVAEYKYKQHREALCAIADDADAIRALIIHEDREQRVLDKANQLACLYSFNPEQIKHIYDWIIKMTIQVEINYIQRRIRESSPS